MRISAVPRNRRLLGAAAVLVVLGASLGVTQISSADTNDRSKAASGAGKQVNGLTILTDTCVDSRLEKHDGFQKGERCVSTEFGEVGAAADNPTLLITRAPRSVRAGEPFQLQVSTRNLIRDRFLAAGKGGYYVESSVLGAQGLVRGHFHTACRMLSSTREAVDPAPVPAFFVATEDGGGGARPDTVTIQVPGMPDEGTAQCASWAGDGSHRVPMMERANQTPAFDAVRIRVARAAAPEQPPASSPPATDPPASSPPATEPPAAKPPAEEPPAEEPPVKKPPAVTPKPPAAEPEPEAPVKEAAKPTTTRTTTKRAAPAAEEDGKDTEPEVAAGSLLDDDDADSSSGKADSSKADSKAAGSGEADSRAAGDSTGGEADATGSEAEDATDGAVDVVAEPAAAPADRAGRLALTGSSTMKVIGGGLVLLAAGLLAMFVTRRRPTRSTGWR